MKKPMSQELAALIKQYLAGHKSRSLKGLSKKTAVSYPTLRRILHEGVAPTMESVLPLIQYLCTKDQALEFLKKYSRFGSWLEHCLQSDQDPMSQQINRFTQDKEKFMIISMAATKNGTTREKVRDLLGSWGETKMEALLEESILKEAGGHITAEMNKIGAFSTDCILAQLKHATEIFDKKNVGTPSAIAGMQTEGVCNEGLRLISAAMQEAEIKVTDIRKKYRGSKTMFAGFIFNVID